jgi:hypothetical protein
MSAGGPKEWCNMPMLRKPKLTHFISGGGAGLFSPTPPQREEIERHRKMAGYSGELVKVMRLGGAYSYQHGQNLALEIEHLRSNGAPVTLDNPYRLARAKEWPAPQGAYLLVLMESLDALYAAVGWHGVSELQRGPGSIALTDMKMLDPIEGAATLFLESLPRPEMKAGPGNTTKTDKQVRLPADHYNGKFGIPAGRLASARRDGWLKNCKKKNGRWLYHDADVRALWPQDFIEEG